MVRSGPQSSLTCGPHNYHLGFFTKGENPLCLRDSFTEKTQCPRGPQRLLLSTMYHPARVKASGYCCVFWGAENYILEQWFSNCDFIQVRLKHSVATGDKESRNHKQCIYFKFIFGLHVLLMIMSLPNLSMSVFRLIRGILHWFMKCIFISLS